MTATPVLRPHGKDQLLNLDGQTGQTADPLLVFATTHDLYYPGPRIVGYPPGPSYQVFAGYRVLREVQSEGIYSGGTSDELMAYQAAKLKLQNAVYHAFDKLAKPGFLKTAIDENPLPPVPEVPLNLDSRILPPGSLLLCRSRFDEKAGLQDGRYYSDTWYSLTPDEANEQNPLRGCGMVLPTGEHFISKRIGPFSMCHDFSEASGMMARWPQGNRKAHETDIRARYQLMQKAPEVTVVIKPAPEKSRGFFSRFLGSP